MLKSVTLLDSFTPSLDIGAKFQADFRLCPPLIAEKKKYQGAFTLGLKTTRLPKV